MAEQPIGVMTVDSSSSPSSQIELSLTIQTNDDKNNNNAKLDESSVPKKKKKNVNILKVALMLLRRRSQKSNNPAVDVASKGIWNRLIGAMRPLHLQTDDSPPLQLLPSVPTTESAPPRLHPSPSADNFEDTNSSASSVDGMSRYASAANLQELDQNDHDDEDENNSEGNENMNGENEMVDVEAEMFIAQFYAQMRLQRSDSDIHYEEMTKRSMG